ncbi:unnamed protein product [Diatraea saccharalis]|uniref:Strictosidine synthase conserved region domain-containing protein n=1 Tax=Diatraea saccharalis TaxID=40085 RepID=A0A9N9WG19_9NEOP|nr:unnamed protein product [Diatraea saccharalis]
MGLVLGLLKKLFKAGVCFLVFAALIILIPNIPPYTSFTRITLEPPQPLTGPLAPNGALDNAEKLFIDKVLGPEAFQLYKGEVYTSLATGEIVKLTPGGHVTFVTKIGQPCTGIKQEHICGRPLGFVFDEKNNQMYVADAYHGIWKIDLKTDKKQLLVSPNVEIKGRTPKLFNHVALDGLGNLYWTDSTSDFKLKDGAMSMLSDPSGRLFKYNAITNTSTVLLDNLWFPNGVIVSPDDQFLVIAETFAHRLLKYYISGPKKGKSEVFASGLPGAPDNLRALPDGSGMLVGMPITYDDENPHLSHSLAAAPYVRKFLARIQRLIEIPFEFLNSYYPHFVFEDIVYRIGHFDSLSNIITNPSGLLQLDWNGNIIVSYYNKDGSVGFISDGIVFNDKLYLGRPHAQNFVGSVPAPPLLKKAFSGKPSPGKQEPSKTAKAPTPKEQPKVQEAVKVTTPKPTTPKAPETDKVTSPKTATAPKASEPAKVTTPKPVKEPKVVADSKPKVEASKPTTQPPKATPPTTQQPPKKASTQDKPTVPLPKAQEKNNAPKPTQEPPKAQSAQVQKPKSDDKVKTTTTKPSQNKATGSTNQKPTPQAQKSGSGSSPKVQKQSQQNIPKNDKKAAPQQIPIKEDIPSDTIKPSKENLKVIKKEGPTEIPNPNL